MQTRHTRVSARPAACIRRSAAAAVLAVVLSLSACSLPRIDGRAEAEWEPSACESALYSALEYDDIAGSSAPMTQRYFASRSAWSSWLDVAASCSARFDEGVIRAAQAAGRAVTLGTHLGVDEHTWDDRVEEQVLSTEDECEEIAQVVDLSAAALAEDRVGFAFELLTARGVDNTSLSLSDWNKTIAQLMASAADEDTRQKVYDIDVLLNSPDTTVDAANGLRASTVAVIEMDCARSLIEAADAGGTAAGDDDDSDSADGADSSGTSGDANDSEDADNDSTDADETADTDDATDTDDDSAADSDDSSNADDSSTSSDNSSDEEQTAALRAYAALAVEHAYRAIRLGYPAIDEALLDSSDTAQAS